MSDAATQLRDALVPADTGHGRGLPGATVRVITRGALTVNVYSRDGEDWLSTSSVLKVMRYGEMPPDIPPAALEYARLRGQIVGETCELWVQAGCPDAADYGAAMDATLVEWREQQGRAWKNFSVVPYLVGLAGFCEQHDYTPTATEVLVADERTRTFGYADLVDADGGVVELKTSKRLYRSHVLQAASYSGDAASLPVVVRVAKDGTYEACPVTTDDEDHFAWLARSALELVAEWGA